MRVAKTKALISFVVTAKLIKREADLLFLDMQSFLFSHGVDHLTILAHMF